MRSTTQKPIDNPKATGSSDRRPESHRAVDFDVQNFDSRPIGSPKLSVVRSTTQKTIDDPKTIDHCTVDFYHKTFGSRPIDSPKIVSRLIDDPKADRRPKTHHRAIDFARLYPVPHGLLTNYFVYVPVNLGIQTVVASR